MKVRELGHAVIKVRNRERSEQFYGETLGMKLAARHESMPMTFYTLGNHHDLALLEVGEEGPKPPTPRRPASTTSPSASATTSTNCAKRATSSKPPASRSSRRSTTWSQSRST